MKTERARCKRKKKEQDERGRKRNKQEEEEKGDLVIVQEVQAIEEREDLHGAQRVQQVRVVPHASAETTLLSRLLITDFFREDSPLCLTRAITRTKIGPCYTPLSLAPKCQQA